MTYSRQGGRPPNTGRDAEIANRLAAGERTGALAKEFGVTPGRIRGIRSEHSAAIAELESEFEAGKIRAAAIAADIDRQAAYSAGYNAALAETANRYIDGFADARRIETLKSERRKLETAYIKVPDWRRKAKEKTAEIDGILSKHRRIKTESATMH